jgi:hypothetical protein
MKEVDTIIDFEAFEANFRDAQGYYQRALQFQEEKQRSSLVFNVAAIALERYLIALCDLYGKEARNHNYISLVNVAETLVEIPPELVKKIKSLDWIFGICSIDDYRHPNPDVSDMENVLLLCREVQKLFDPSRISGIRSDIRSEEEHQNKQLAS